VPRWTTPCKHGDDLIGGARIDDLLARIGQQRLFLAMPAAIVAAVAFALVMAPDGLAVASWRRSTSEALIFFPPLANSE
jgi:hypothetical protein